MTVEAFDSVLKRLASTAMSLTEQALLAELWSHGEDGWLREDDRFRPTPWGRWIPSDRYLINDLLVRELRDGETSELPLAEQLATLASVTKRQTAVCLADPRLQVDNDKVRLAPSELTDEPLLEEVGPLLQYVSHLPVLTLQAAAASEPNGEWGPRAEAQHVEPKGWLRVEHLGRPLNARMFVARVKGASMSGGARPIHDGDWAVFEYSFHRGVAYDTGSDQPVVLVRGDFSDPETGTYAVKRWERSAPDVRLVSTHPDKERFPDIVVPLDEADHLRIVASFTTVLRVGDFARRPRPTRTSGRRVVEGQAGLTEQGERLERRIASFFEGTPSQDTEEDGVPQQDGWSTRLTCLEPTAGGLALEVGPLDGLPPFAKKLRVVGAAGRDSIILAANTRQRPASVAMAPGSGPWRWEAIGFEDEEDLGLDRLDAEALPTNTATVFRVDAVGVGRRQQGRMLARGQLYRLLIPPVAADEEIGDALVGGWRLWTIDLELPPSRATLASLEDLGVSVGDAWPRLEWALFPPAAWKNTPRGEPYPVFEASRGVAVRVTGLPSEDDDESPMLYVQGPSGVERLTLPRGSADALISLGPLAEGRWACALIHPRTAVRTTTLLFEVASSAVQTVDASWSVDVERTQDGAMDLSTLTVTAPPGWPVTLAWRVLGTVPLATAHADADGGVELTRALERVGDRARRARLSDLLIDLAELGHEECRHDRRPSVEQVREELLALWEQRESLVRTRRGAWLTLVPQWFTPVCDLLGYALEELGPAASMEAEDSLAAWRMVVDERDDGAIRRSTTRVLVLTADLAGTLSGGADAVDHACAAADVRDAIVSDGVLWTTHRRGNRLPRTTWHIGEVLAGDGFEALLADLSEGLG